MAKKQTTKTSVSFDDLLDQFVDLEEEDQITNASTNRHKMYRLVVKMADKANKFEDCIEVLCILSHKSKYFKTVFDKAHSLTTNFDDCERLIDCCEEGDEYYSLILQDQIQKATTLEDWFIVFDNIESLIRHYKGLGFSPFEDDPSLDKIGDFFDNLDEQLEDSFNHILNLSKTVEDCDAVIYMLTNGSDHVEETIKKRDFLIKSQK